MHIKLSEQQVLEIYSYRPLPDGCGERSPLAGRSSELSRIYGISTKAIRDIWNLRSWAHVTQKDAEPVDKQVGSPTTTEPKTLLAVRQPPGRPMLLKEAAKAKSRKRSRSSAAEDEDGDDTRAGAELFEVLLDLAKRRKGDDASDPNHTVSATLEEGDEKNKEGSDKLPGLSAFGKDGVPQSLMQQLPMYGWPNLSQAQHLKPHELQMLQAQVQQAQMNFNFLAVAANFPPPALTTPFGVMPVNGFPNSNQSWDLPSLQPIVGVQNV